MFAQYYLRPSVHICRANGRFIFLDVKQDRYFGLDRENTAAVTPHLFQSCSDFFGSQRDASVVTDDVSLQLKKMVDQGIVTTDKTEGKPASFPSVCPPTTPLLTDESHPVNKVTARDIFNFYLSAIYASFALKRRSLDFSIQRFRRRKHKHCLNSEVRVDTLARAVSVFNRLRYFYPREYLCLFDSLALLEFLSRYRVYPTWVFGVTAEPFSAHCWIQHKQFACNEAAEIAGHYTPIMAV